MIRAVIDTNVLVSGLLSPAGNEALIVLAIHQGFVRPCLSEPIIAEYAAVLARPKFAFPPEEIEAVLAMLQGTGEIFRPEESPVVSPDPADTKFQNVLHRASFFRLSGILFPLPPIGALLFCFGNPSFTEIKYSTH